MSQDIQEPPNFVPLRKIKVNYPLETRNLAGLESIGRPLGRYVSPDSSGKRAHVIEYNTELAHQSLGKIVEISNNLSSVTGNSERDQVRTIASNSLRQIYNFWSVTPEMIEIWNRAFVRGMHVHELTHKDQDDRFKLFRKQILAYGLLDHSVNSETRGMIIKDLILVRAYAEVQAFARQFNVVAQENFRAGQGVALLSMLEKSAWPLHRSPETLIVLLDMLKRNDPLELILLSENKVDYGIANLIIMTQDPDILDKFLANEMDSQQLQMLWMQKLASFANDPSAVIARINERDFQLRIDSKIHSSPIVSPKN